MVLLFIVAAKGTLVFFELVINFFERKAVEG